MNAESVSMPVFAQWPTVQGRCRQLKNETVKWNVNYSVQKVNKIFCALFRLSNNTALGEKAIYRWFCFPPVVHEQILGEIEN